MALTKIKADGLTADLIDETKLADNSIDSEHYNDSSIDNAHLSDNAVNTAEITDNAVTHAKYQDIPTGRLLGRTSSGTGDPETLDDSTVRAFLGVSAGANQTTINTNGDNRVLTGTGTANTIQGESQLLFDSNGLLYIKAPDGGNRYFFGETGDSASAQLSLYNSSDEQKVRIAAGDGGNLADTYFNGGNVGIGTTSPAPNSASYNGATLHLHQTNSSSAGSQVKLTTGASGATSGDGSFIAQWSDNNLYINNQENAAIKFFANGSERAKIDSDGLKFGTDTAAANALDDYEEGTWTPVPNLTYNPNGRSITIGSSSGTYTKVGRMVLIEYLVQWTAISGSGAYNVGCSGLPFAAEGTQTVVCGCIRSNVTGNTFVAESLQNNEINVFRQYNNGSPNTNDSMSGFAIYHST